MNTKESSEDIMTSKNNPSNGAKEKAEQHVGTVKWFNEEKGYGFIEQEDGRDLFVHYKEIRGKLKAGDRVNYVLGEGKKGPCATQVKVV